MMTQANRQPLVVAVCILLSLLCVGCFGAIRVPSRTIAPSGEEKQAGVDLEFIHPGQTSRADVLQSLGWLDTGVKHERLFIARWVGSSWAVALGQTGGRYWTAHNLLVEFDGRGLVTRHEVVSDGSLARELEAWAVRVQDKPLDLVPPIVIPVKHIHTWVGPFPEAFLILGEQLLEFKEPGDGSHVRLSPAKIARLTSTTMDTGTGIPHPNTVALTFHFTEKTRAGKKLGWVAVDVPTMMILVRYTVQNRPIAR